MSAGVVMQDRGATGISSNPDEDATEMITAVENPVAITEQLTMLFKRFGFT